MAKATGNTKEPVFTSYRGRRPFALSTETLIVFRGRVQYAKNHFYSVVRTKSATLRVWWAGGIVPPDVYPGTYVMVAGKIVTYDNGKDHRVSDALLLNAAFSWKRIMVPVYQQLFRFSKDPANWVPKEVIDMYRFKRGWKKSIDPYAP